MRAEIEIQTIQRTDGEEDVIVHKAKGTFRRENGQIHLAWVEAESGTHSTAVLDGQEALIRRSGGAETEILYRRGYVHECVYRTSAGALVLAFDTRAFAFIDEGERVALELDYAICSDGTALSTCSLRLCAQVIG